jgi:hypothetical protein
LFHLWRLGVGALLALGGAPEAAAQDSKVNAGPKAATAVRVDSGAIRLDGRLDEAAWQRAEAVTDFVQKEPVEGASPSQRMEVRFVFDDAVLFVGARMYSADPSAIQAPMGRRDNVEQAEYIQLSLDTYLDRRTAYTFGVSASGVRFDHYHPQDTEDDADSTFDPVWEASTAIDEQGWTAELRVPFSQLRFNESTRLVWGMNIRRYVPTLNEESDWVLVRRTEEGWASRFGDLNGLDGLRPPTRLEVVPYAATSSRLPAEPDPANPFDGGINGAGRVGADVKLKVGPNLTLDATVNPDFGQVEADPAEVNLSANETFFDERRPFFLEGSALLAGSSNNFFYSRRVGATPRGPADGDYVDYPPASTIIGAAKLTGRLQSGTSLGLLGAVTGEEFARTSVGADPIARTLVAPTTVFAVGRVVQELGSGGSTAGLHLTGLHRDLPAESPLAGLFVANAVTGAVDTLVRLRDSTYEGRVVVGFSYIDGEPGAIERVQRSSVHYFQRPDRTGGALLDAARTSMSGVQLRSDFDRIAGRHWLWGVTVNADSPEFETNDVGRLSGAGEIDLRGRLTYRETQPGRVFRGYDFGVELERTTDWDSALGGIYTVTSDNSFDFANFWEAEFFAEVQTRGQDPRLTRGGPSMGTPQRWTLFAELANNEASRTRWGVSSEYGGSEDGDLLRSASVGFSVRPRTAWQLSIEPTYVRERATRQFVDALAGGRPETFGGRYVFGEIDRSTVSMQVRFNYTFKPDFTLEVYAEPFAASGRYQRFGELLEARSRALRFYGKAGTTIVANEGGYEVTDGGSSFTFENEDFDVQSFRSNVVLRWEWRPGSTFYAVWQQDREAGATMGRRAGFQNLWGALSGPGDHILAVKASFWLSR